MRAGEEACGWDRFSRETLHEREERARRRSLDIGRRWNAFRGGHFPPPREKHCPPKPPNGLCECCGKLTKKFHLDDCHDTGAFRGWVCHACNTGTGIMDDVERLEKRIAFLRRAVGA